MKISMKKEGIKIDNFKDPRNQIKYQEKMQERLEEKGGQDPGKIWKNIIETCTQIAEEFQVEKIKILGIKAKL